MRSPQRVSMDSMKLSPHGVLVESLWSPHSPHRLHEDSTWSLWRLLGTSRKCSHRFPWSPHGVHGNVWGSVKYSQSVTDIDDWHDFCHISSYEAVHSESVNFHVMLCTLNVITTQIGTSRSYRIPYISLWSITSCHQ